MLGLVDRRYFYALVFGYHVVFQVPSCSACQLCNNNVAVAEKVDVEGNVVNRLFHVSCNTIIRMGVHTSREM